MDTFPPPGNISADKDDTPSLDDTQFNAHIHTLRDYQRRQRWDRWDRWDRWCSLSWIAWLLDTSPADIYPQHEFRRSATQEARRQWLRVHVSWSFLGRFQTAFGVKVATSLPVCAALIQSIPELKGRVPIHVFGWIYVAGLCWLTSLIIYQCRCPRLLKVVNATSGNLVSTPRQQLLSALVEAAFDSLIYTRIWKLPSHLREEDGYQVKTAMLMATQGYTPIFEGFGPYAQSLIERALYEWASKQGVQILEESEGVLNARGQCRYILEGSRKPCVKHLHLQRPSARQIKAQPQFQRTDIILEWRSARFQVTESRAHINQALQRSLMVEGLCYLVDGDASTESIALIAAQWLNWNRLLSRLLVASLYLATLFFVGVFMVIQTCAMLHP